mgnify:CR=1 FL=1
MHECLFCHKPIEIADILFHQEWDCNWCGGNGPMVDGIPGLTKEDELILFEFAMEVEPERRGQIQRTSIPCKRCGLPTIWRRDTEEWMCISVLTKGTNHCSSTIED